MGVNATDGYCRLACTSGAFVGPGMVPTTVDFGPAYTSGPAFVIGGGPDVSIPATLTTRVTASRAVRITLDAIGSSPRMLRVYYSPDDDFAHLTLALAIEAPPKLQAAINATVGFTAVNVRLSCGAQRVSLILAAWRRHFTQPPSLVSY